MIFRHAQVLSALFLVLACASPQEDAPPELPRLNDTAPPAAPTATAPPSAAPQTPPESGELRVLTYNIAGLPDGISKSEPAKYTKLISPKLEPYPLVLVQEDFSYHADLIASVTHSHLTPPKTSGGISGLGDGLNMLSRHAFAGFERVTWETCHGIVDSGSDCLAAKGFTFARLALAPGVELDVYNVHADAGRSDGDVRARDRQVAQLVREITTRSAQRAVLLAGDTNMKASDEPTFQTLLRGGDLVDACRVVSCPEPDRIDRIMVRSSRALELALTDWTVETTFRDAAGNELSDHEPVAATLRWKVR
jgi:hypothetical protein